MTNEEIKQEIVKIIECSIQDLDGIDLFISFYETLYDNIDGFFDILEELIREGILKRKPNGLITYYVIND